MKKEKLKEKVSRLELINKQLHKENDDLIHSLNQFKTTLELNKLLERANKNMTRTYNDAIKTTVKQAQEIKRLHDYINDNDQLQTIQNQREELKRLADDNRLLQEVVLDYKRLIPENHKTIINENKSN
jgi:hypothetical protein